MIRERGNIYEGMRLKAFTKYEHTKIIEKGDIKMYKKFLGVFLCITAAFIVLLSSAATVYAQTTIVAFTERTEMVLRLGGRNGTIIGTNHTIPTRSHFYVGEEVFPQMRNAQTGIVRREGWGGLSSWNDETRRHSQSGPNGGIVFLNPGIHHLHYVFILDLGWPNPMQVYEGGVTLEVRPANVNRNALRELLALAGNIERGIYTQATWNLLQSRIGTAQNAYDNRFSTQIQINTAYTNLRNAINGLIEYRPITVFDIFHPSYGIATGIINQHERTITFRVPQDLLDNQWTVNSLVTNAANNTALFTPAGGAAVNIFTGSPVNIVNGGTASVYTSDIIYTVNIEPFEMGRINEITVSNGNNEFVGNIDHIARTITFYIAPADLWYGIFDGHITHLNTDNNALITISGGGVIGNQPNRGAGGGIRFNDGANAFVPSSSQYTILVRNLPIIRGITVGGVDAVIDQTARTITFHVANVGNMLFGIVSNFDADGLITIVRRDGLTSTIDGNGSPAMLNDGYMAYISTSHQYTIIFAEPQSRITRLVIDGFEAELNAARDTFTFQIPSCALYHEFRTCKINP